MWGNAEGTDALLDCLRDAAVRVDARGIVLFANRAAYDLFGDGGPRLGARIGTLVPDCTGLAPRPDAPVRLTATLSEGRSEPLTLDISAVAGSGGNAGSAIFVFHPVACGTAVPAPGLHDALAEAQLAQRRLREIIEMMPEAVCVFDAEDRYVLWNPKYAATYPEIAHLLAPGAPFVDILRASLNSGEMRERAIDPETWLAERLARHALPSSQTEQEFRDGCWFRHDDRRLADGGAIGMRIDITDLKRKEASLRTLFEDNPVPMLIFEPETLRITAVNAAAIALYGFSAEEFLNKSAPELHLDDEAEAARGTFASVTGSYQGRTIWKHKTASGAILHVLIFIRALVHEQRPGLLTAVADVSDRVEAEAQVFHLANHDALTGLANRFRFRKALERALADQAPGQDVVIHCLDLDGFKPVNDTLGHSGGDEVLRRVAARLRAAVRHTDLVARLGGDEFAILQTAPGADREVLGARLVAAFRSPFVIGEQTVSIGVSVGYAVAPQDGEDADALLVAADTALYSAKRAGKNTWRRHNRRRLAG